MAKVQEFATEYGLESPVLVDGDGAVGRSYQLRATPTTFFIDPDGKIEDIQIGFVKSDWIQSKLQEG